MYTARNTYKKGTTSFFTNHNKTRNNFDYFNQGFDNLFSAFIDKLSECRIL